MTNIKNKIFVALDPELRAINSVIRRTNDLSGHLDHARMQDFFVDRISRFPQSLKMRFWEHHFEWKAVMKYPEINGRILDFGCGSGHSDIWLARNGYTIHGIDTSITGIAIAEYLRNREEALVKSRLSFSIDDVTEPPSEKDPFDSAWAAHVFEHVEKPGPVLEGLRRRLKKGAYILISVPLADAYDDPGHVYHFYDRDQFAHHLRHYVQIVRLDVSQEYQVIRALCRFD